MKQLIAVVLLLSTLVAVNAYTCPTSCVLPNCRCASVNPPGGISRATAPQFVHVTFDDAINDNVFPSVMEVLNVNAWDTVGCKPRATFFLTNDLTNYTLVTRLHALGHEIASHTITHQTGFGLNYRAWEAEIKWGRNFTAELGKIPISDLRGFRAPYLNFTRNHFDAMYANGFDYDASMVELEFPGSMSLFPSNIIWPYTLDYGTPQLCNYSNGADVTCPRPTGYAGMWEIPVWSLYEPTFSEAIASFDPTGEPDFLLNVFKANFFSRYNNSRAPFGINLHAVWLTRDIRRVQVLKDFFTWVQQFPDVYFATIDQIVEWMKAPANSASTRTRPTFACPTLPTTPSPEVCDGIDNDLNGLVDEGTFITCVYPRGSFSTCASQCPKDYPSVAPEYCGDGQCMAFETCTSCPADCGACPEPWSGAVSFAVASSWSTGLCVITSVVNPFTVPARFWSLSLSTVESAVVTSAWGSTFSSTRTARPELVFDEGHDVFTIQPLFYSRVLNYNQVLNTTGFCMSYPYSHGLAHPELTQGDLRSVLAASIKMFARDCGVDSCAPTCGDGVCGFISSSFNINSSAENCTTCPEDCGPCELTVIPNDDSSREDSIFGVKIPFSRALAIVGLVIFGLIGVVIIVFCLRRRYERIDYEEREKNRAARHMLLEQGVVVTDATLLRQVVEEEIRQKELKKQAKESARREKESARKPSVTDVDKSETQADGSVNNTDNNNNNNNTENTDTSVSGAGWGRLASENSLLDTSLQGVQVTEPSPSARSGRSEVEMKPLPSTRLIRKMK